MKISEILSRSAQPFPSIEIVPPLKGISKEELMGKVVLRVWPLQNFAYYGI